MEPEQLIRSVAEEAQAQLDTIYERGNPPPDSDLDQAGLRNGLAIVEEFLTNGEAGLAFEHLVYMVTEPPLPLSVKARDQIEAAAAQLGMSAVLKKLREH
jgi:hypothetical protein